MPKRKPLIRSILNGKLRGDDQTPLVKDEVTDDVRILQEISLQVEQEKISGLFDATFQGARKLCLTVEMDDVYPGAKKRPAPKYNKVLKEAEQAALQKPLSPYMYRLLVNEHLEILPFLFKKIDKNTSH